MQTTQDEVTRIQNAIMSALRENGKLSFPDLMTSIEGFARTPGSVGSTIELRGPDFSNVLAWANMTPAAVEAVIDLRTRGLLHFSPVLDQVSMFLYGGAMRLPLAKALRHYPINRPRWSPMWIVAGPAPRKASRSRACRQLNRVCCATLYQNSRAAKAAVVSRGIPKSVFL